MLSRVVLSGKTHGSVKLELFQAVFDSDSR